MPRQSPELRPAILELVSLAIRRNGILLLVLLTAFSIAACHKEEQAVEGVAKNAAQTERRAQASATEHDEERAELDEIPLPTKSLYIDIHDPSAWINPFLSVGPETLSLRIILPDANPSPAGEGTLLRPAAARRQELTLRLSDLDKAIAAIPAGAWRYGRVIAVEESSSAPAADRPKVRRNVEAVIRQLNDLGIVVEEWPAR
jgi:malate synthase